MKELSTTQFYATFVIPFLDAALRFYDLFEVDAHDCESFCDVWVNREKGVFSKDQILSILGNAFFCSFAVREEVYEDDLPSIGYDEIHTGDARVLVTKLRLLFDYVTETVCPTAANTPERMEVYRCELASLPPPHDSNDTVQPPVMHQLGESIDDQQSMIRLDFANAWIGGGALADGCVQEEITFAQCCGLNTLRWNQRPLKEEESVVVKGYAQYGVVEKGTYGFNISYGGCIAGGKIMGGALAVVDAADFRFHPASDQYSTAFIRRELQKLLSALLHPSVKDITSVAGGNWGCGIFGGDYELKFLIQWLACCISKKQLHYFPFDNECFEEFNSTLCALVESGCTVKELEEFLLVSEIPETRSVWDSFVTFFAEARQAKQLDAEDDESD
ncbi:poly(ADP-ribose) glycohydrolase [Angomonas deanei]|nr:poly(ADP-ribose) glycohydrolase [Angomonas deanei]|eukprot:EPY21547.1 poly(ADP-ribose) glycohydrolase [Angomonas deanei]